MRVGHPRPAAGHRARAHLPGAGRQGDLRRARRAVRDAGDREPRRSCPTCAGAAGETVGDPVADAADVGRVGVGAGRAARAAHRRARPRSAWRTIAFLASGIEGLKVRITAKAPDEATARAMLAAEEDELRAVLGPLVFGVDDETMEFAVAALLDAHGLTLGLAESVTGGLLASRLTDVAGVSGVFRGAVVSYDSEVKFDVLGVAEGPVVTARAAERWRPAPAACSAPTSGSPITGVAGPAEQDGMPVGTVFVGLAIGDDEPESIRAAPAGRPAPHPRVRRHLGARPPPPPRACELAAREPAPCGCSSPPGRRRRSSTALRSIERPEQRGLRFTTEDQWHVTLRFLGDVDDDDVDAVVAAARRGRLQRRRRGRARRRASAPRPDAVVARRRRARRRSPPPSRAAARSGLGGDDRRFHGHVTLARMRRPGRWPSVGVGGLAAPRARGRSASVTLVAQPPRSRSGPLRDPGDRAAPHVDLSPDPRPGRSGGDGAPGSAGGRLGVRRRGPAPRPRRAARSHRSRCVASSARSRSQRRRPASQARASAWFGGVVMATTQAHACSRKLAIVTDVTIRCRWTTLARDA